MKNPFKKKKKEEKKVEDKTKKPMPRRSALNEPPIPKEDIPMSDNEYKLNHLVETELNVIQKKAKSLHLNSEEGFTEKSDNNYWKVSVNEFMRYINQRSQIIIDQLSKKSHAVDIDIDASGE